MLPLQRPDQHAAQESAGLDTLGRSVGGPGTQSGHLDGQAMVGVTEHRHRGQPHDASVTSGAGVGRSAEWLARLPKPLQRVGHRVADVEAPPCAAEVALADPPPVAPHLVVGIEPSQLGEAGSEAECHRGVVGPGAGRELEYATAHHVRDGFEPPARGELDGGTHGIAAGQTQQATSKAPNSSGPIGCFMSLPESARFQHENL